MKSGRPIVVFCVLTILIAGLVPGAAGLDCALVGPVWTAMAVPVVVPAEPVPPSDDPKPLDPFLTPSGLRGPPAPIV